MKLVFAIATNTDAAELAALNAATAEDLTQRFGPGFWSSPPSERGILANMRMPKFSRFLVARSNHRIIGTLRLATKKPWAIDTAYFTPASKPRLSNRHGRPSKPPAQRNRPSPDEQAESLARAWPADAIRLDAFDAAAGAGPFYAKCGYREVARRGLQKGPAHLLRADFPQYPTDLRIFDPTPA